MITFTLQTIQYVEIISGIVCLKKLYWHKILPKQIKRKVHIFPIFANVRTWEKKPWIYGICTDNSTIITSYCTKFKHTVYFKTFVCLGFFFKEKNCPMIIYNDGHESNFNKYECQIKHDLHSLTYIEGI